MAHFRRRRPRTRTQIAPRYDSTPSWWNILMHHRPRRRAAKALLHELARGRDPEGIAWPLYRKPHKYYW